MTGTILVEDMMVIRHNCIRRDDGSMVIMTSMNGQVGPSRNVTQVDWHNTVCPTLRQNCVRIAHNPVTGDSVWEEKVNE